MRIRVSSRQPLPSVKAWFSLAKATQTIQDLKQDLCANIPAFEDGEIRPSEIALAIDDFDLLDEGPADVLRENDLVWWVGG